VNGALAAYRILTGLAEPLSGIALRLGAREETAALHAERLARPPGPVADTWWHAASLGEVAALEPLLDLARRRLVAGRFAVTTATVTGRGAARGLWGEAVSLAPLDLPRAVRRAFDRRRPRSLVLVETELWPNWLAEAARRGTAVAVVNGRISDRALPRYRGLSRLFRPLLAGLRAVAARSEADRERFLGLGVPGEAVRVAGNLKHDRLAEAAPATLPWTGAWVWTVGSLRPGEERAVLAAFEALRGAHPELRLVLALRHPEAWNALDGDLERRGLRPARRSRPDPRDREADVLIVDTHGELPGIYAASSAAFVGGTLVPVGGHNVLEAAVAGVPVLFGPHVANVAEDAQALLDAEGARRVEDARSLAEALQGWLADPGARERAAAGARRAARALRGASERTLKFLMERGALPRHPTP
jgi:3-deoxy-D-manno-octulosonic-acid transferase